jgi:hypothetical protein
MNKRIITLNTRNATEQISLGFNAKSATVINHTPFRVFVRFGNFDIPDENNKDLAAGISAQGWTLPKRCSSVLTSRIVTSSLPTRKAITRCLRRSSHNQASSVAALTPVCSI